MGKPKRTIIMNGFSKDEVIGILRGVRGMIADSGDIAFGTLTANNKSWTLEELINELHREHEQMKNKGVPPV